jgi:hypothetical protein
LWHLVRILPIRIGINPQLQPTEHRPPQPTRLIAARDTQTGTAATSDTAQSDNSHRDSLHRIISRTASPATDTADNETANSQIRQGWTGCRVKRSVAGVSTAVGVALASGSGAGCQLRAVLQCRRWSRFRRFGCLSGQLDRQDVPGPAAAFGCLCGWGGVPVSRRSSHRSLRLKLFLNLKVNILGHFG